MPGLEATPVNGAWRFHRAEKAGSPAAVTRPVVHGRVKDHRLRTILVRRRTGYRSKLRAMIFMLDTMADRQSLETVTLSSLKSLTSDFCCLKSAVCNLMSDVDSGTFDSTLRSRLFVPKSS
jgi:hypothetical protein